MNLTDHPAPESHLVFAGLTDVGRRRSVNQDRFVALSLDTPAGPATLLAVADGMGGAAGGEVASAHAVDELLRVFNEVPPDRSDGELLHTSILAANQAIFGHAQVEPELLGMGTTMVALLVRGSAVVAAHVGDSRAYLLRGDTVQRLTADHSWVAEQVRRGEITEEEAATSSFRNVLTRSVGVGDGVAVELSDAIALQPGDVLLLCSDGLHGVVDDATIARIARDADPAMAARQLIDLANERGGPDNITVVIGRVPATSPSATVPVSGEETTVEAPVPVPIPVESAAPVPADSPAAVPAAPAPAAGRSRRWLYAAAAVAAVVVVGVSVTRSGGNSSAPAAPAAAPPIAINTVIPGAGGSTGRMLPPAPGLDPCNPEDSSQVSGRRLTQSLCKFTPAQDTRAGRILEQFGVPADCVVAANPETLDQSLRTDPNAGDLVVLHAGQTYRLASLETCIALRSERVNTGGPVFPGTTVNPTPLPTP